MGHRRRSRSQLQRQDGSPRRLWLTFGAPLVIAPAVSIYVFLNLWNPRMDDSTAEARKDRPYEPGVQKRVNRGGSYLCSDRYCSRYLVGNCGKGEPSTGSSNVGFLCVKSAQ